MEFDDYRKQNDERTLYDESCFKVLISALKYFPFIPFCLKNE